MNVETVFIPQRSLGEHKAMLTMKVFIRVRHNTKKIPSDNCAKGWRKNKKKIQRGQLK